MAAPSPSPRQAAATVAAAVLVASVAVVAFLTVPGGSACTPGNYAPYCPVGTGPITYVTTDFAVPETGNLTNVTFAEVAFHLWSAYGGLEGTASEPDGITVDFFQPMPAAAPASVAGEAPPPPSPWISPDGTFGIAVLGSTSGALQLELEVASPEVLYSSDAVALHLENASRTVPTVVLVQGVAFVLTAVGLGPFEAPSLFANGTEPNGIGVSLRLAGGPAVPVACAAPTPAEASLLDQGACLYAGALNEGVAVLWNGQLSATLLVRQA